MLYRARWRLRHQKSTAHTLKQAAFHSCFFFLVVSLSETIFNGSHFNWMQYHLTTDWYFTLNKMWSYHINAFRTLIWECVERIFLTHLMNDVKIYIWFAEKQRKKIKQNQRMWYVERVQREPIPNYLCLLRGAYTHTRTHIKRRRRGKGETICSTNRFVWLLKFDACECCLFIYF